MRPWRFRAYQGSIDVNFQGGEYMSSGLLFAIACALAALAYGIQSSNWILSLPTGNDRMRQISGAPLRFEEK